MIVIFAECTGYQVRIRDTASGEEIKQFKGYNSYYNQIAFSDDGNSLLLARGERKREMTCMTLHSISTSKPPLVFGGKRIASVTAVSMFPDGTRSVSLEQRGVIAVWDAGDGREIKRWKHTASPSSVGDVVYRKQLPGNLVMEMTNPIIWGLSSVAVSPDGKRILSGGGDRYMRLWTPAGEELWEYPHDSRVVRVAFLPDGSRALAGCWDGSVHLWKLPG